MNRPIKFRGRDKNGKFRYGDFNDIDLGTIFADVDEDSIALLVGYDSDGREVYEGDELADNYEGADYEYVAWTTVFAYSKPAGVIRHLHNVRLKEAVK